MYKIHATDPDIDSPRYGWANLGHYRLPAEYLLADKGYDTNFLVAGDIAEGMEPVIPPRSYRKAPRVYDRDLHRLRHRVENAFLN